MKHNKLRITLLAIFLGVIALFLGLILLAILKLVQVQAAVTIFIATMTAATGWWVSNFAKTKLDLQVNASSEVISAVQSYSKAVSEFKITSSYVTPQFPPKPTPTNFWYNAVYEELKKLAEAWLKFTKTQADLRNTIEANEMAVVELEHLYRYLMIEHDKASKQFQDISSKLSSDTMKVNNETKYNKVLGYFSALEPSLRDLSCWCLDLNKEILNKYQSNIFGRRLKKRRPLDGTKTLTEMISKQEMDKIIQDMESEYNKNK